MSLNNSETASIKTGPPNFNTSATIYFVPERFELLSNFLRCYLWNFCSRGLPDAWQTSSIRPRRTQCYIKSYKAQVLRFSIPALAPAYVLPRIASPELHIKVHLMHMEITAVAAIFEFAGSFCKRLFCFIALSFQGRSPPRVCCS